MAYWYTIYLFQSLSWAKVVVIKIYNYEKKIKMIISDLLTIILMKSLMDLKKYYQLVKLLIN